MPVPSVGSIRVPDILDTAGINCPDNDPGSPTWARLSTVCTTGNLRVCEFTANPSTFPAGHFLASLPRLGGGTLRLLSRVSRAFILLIVHLLEEVDKPNGVDLSTRAERCMWPEGFNFHFTATAGIG